MGGIDDLGEFILHPEEMCFIQYMPIKFPQSKLEEIPKNISWISPIFDRCIIWSIENVVDWENLYWYATVKYMWQGGESYNREGWHIDGYLSDDLNFIWSDIHPTEIGLGKFNLSLDHKKSLTEMAEQVKSVTKLKNNRLVMVGNNIVHRVSEEPFEGMRAFVKLSASKYKYNLLGNAKNLLMDYDWEMYHREEGRNHPYVLEGQ